MSAQLEKNKQTLNAIDNVLDTLEDTTGVIKQNASGIGNELESQIKMADDINNHMDKTNDNINKATNKLVDVQKTGGSNCAAWILMVLFLLIGVVCFIIGAVS